MSKAKKIIKVGLKIAGLFTPLAPGIIASELGKRAIDATLGDESNSTTGKIMKKTIGLMGSDLDTDD